ncbi:MAG: VOC family protein [Ilumatobacteraceae bacterium]
MRRDRIRIERANTILYTDAWAETVAFYRDMLGFEVSFENDWFVEFSIGPSSHLSVADADRSSIVAGDGTGLTISLEVGDVGEVRSTLIEAGVDVGEIGLRFGSPVFDVFDPSGNRIEFWSTAKPPT